MNRLQIAKAGRLPGWCLHTDLAILMIALLPLVWLKEKFTPKKNHGQLWRHAAVWIVRAVFRTNGVTLHAKHLNNILTEPAIYAANHPSEMDGFMLLSILGANTILFTAPLGQFPGLLRFWLRKMQTVDVKRDEIDEARYPESHSKITAIKLAIEHLLSGKSIIIFPEGHTELLHVLHYFHTGAARISLGSHTPIVPVAIVNADQVFPDGHHLNPGLVSLVFNTPIAPPATTHFITDFPKPEVIKLRRQFEKEIVDHLPIRYLPNYYKHKQNHVGVFLDIDRTIYEGLSQKDLIAYLLLLHKIHASEALRVFYWLFLEKMHEIEHRDLMKKSLLTLRGWDVGELNRYIHEAFAKKMIKRIQYGLFPLLKDHAEQNHKLVLVSEAIHPLARAFKDLLHANATLDTKIQASHHCYTGETPCLCYKEQKARLMKQFAERAGIDLNKSYAYADSFSDVPFLSLTRYPTAVNPDDKLLAFASAHDWEVLLDAK